VKKNRFTEGLDEDIRNVLLAQIRNLWTHASTALEGNSLTLWETSFVLEEGLTVSGKPLKDHRDAEGHARAIEWIYRKVESESARFAEQDLFDLHRILVTDPVVDIMRPVGGWKKEANFTLMVRGDADKQEWREYPARTGSPALCGSGSTGSIDFRTRISHGTKPSRLTPTFISLS
jgi:Fic family protein